MTAQDLDVLALVSDLTSPDTEEEYSIPLDISEIISVCIEFNKLGWQIQSQITQILDVGIEESIKNGYVKYESLPHIKVFLNCIYKNQYFGDASSQALDCLNSIQEYEELNKTKFSNLN